MLVGREEMRVGRVGGWKGGGGGGDGCGWSGVCGGGVDFEGGESGEGNGVDGGWRFCLHISVWQ